MDKFFYALEVQETLYVRNPAIAKINVVCCRRAAPDRSLGPVKKFLAIALWLIWLIDECNDGRGGCDLNLRKLPTLRISTYVVDYLIHN